MAFGMRGPRRRGTLRGQQQAAAVGFAGPSALARQAAGFGNPTAATARNISSTQAAVARISREKGVSAGQAVLQLRQVADQIKRRDEILKKARRERQSRLETGASLKRAGIPTSLLQSRTIEFETPGGRYSSTGLPGGQATVTSVQRRAEPVVRPTPVATPPSPRSTSWMESRVHRLKKMRKGR